MGACRKAARRWRATIDPDRLPIRQPFFSPPIPTSLPLPLPSYPVPNQGALPWQMDARPFGWTPPMTHREPISLGRAGCCRQHIGPPSLSLVVACRDTTSCGTVSATGMRMPTRLLEASSANLHWSGRSPGAPCFLHANGAAAERTPHVSSVAYSAS